MAVCLHCELSEVLMRRQAAGEKVTPDTIRMVCEVLADIAASFDSPKEVFDIARKQLILFESEIGAGVYKPDAGRPDHTSSRV